jgi:phosphatidate cytidylyltransferase
LRLRILSALVMAPAALAAAWIGGAALALVIALAGALMGWEWARLCFRGRVDGPGVVAILAMPAATLAGALSAPASGLALLIAGALAVAFLSRGQGEGRLAAFGVLWIGLPCLALVWLAGDPVAGRATILWIFAVVWATDIGAYAVGRALGGPRLAPRLSPNKTWSGLIGGVLCAALAGIVAARLLDLSLSSPLPLLSGLLAVVAQSGDLAESMAKRHFGVKDSSGLIPGHGGLLDRLDGMLAVIPAVAVLSLVGGGSVVTWK